MKRVKLEEGQEPRIVTMTRSEIIQALAYNSKLSTQTIEDVLTGLDDIIADAVRLTSETLHYKIKPLRGLLIETRTVKPRKMTNPNTGKKTEVKPNATVKARFTKNYRIKQNNYGKKD